MSHVHFPPESGVALIERSILLKEAWSTPASQEAVSSLDYPPFLTELGRRSMARAVAPTQHTFRGGVPSRARHGTKSVQYPPRLAVSGARDEKVLDRVRVNSMIILDDRLGMDIASSALMALSPFLCAPNTRSYIIMRAKIRGSAAFALVAMAPQVSSLLVQG